MCSILQHSWGKWLWFPSVIPWHLMFCLHIFRRFSPGRARARRGGGQPRRQASGVRQRGWLQTDWHGHTPGGGQALRLFHQVRWRLSHLRVRLGENVIGGERRKSRKPRRRLTSDVIHKLCQKFSQNVSLHHLNGDAVMDISLEPWIATS